MKKNHNKKNKEVYKFAIGKERLEAFCDAVIAIAVTLLVLEMKIPNLGKGDQSLFLPFIHQLPIYISTIISFLLLAVAG